MNIVKYFEGEILMFLYIGFEGQFFRPLNSRIFLASIESKSKSLLVTGLSILVSLFANPCNNSPLEIFTATF